MTTLTLRRGVEEDVEAIAALEARIFAADAWSAAGVAEEMASERRRVLVAVDGERLVGYAVTVLVAEVADLARIAVAPSHRRRGVARSLLREAHRLATQEGAERMLLEVSARNDRALAFYAAEGFAEIDRRRRYYRDGSDAVVMERGVMQRGREA